MKVPRRERHFDTYSCKTRVFKERGAHKFIPKGRYRKVQRKYLIPITLLALLALTLSTLAVIVYSRSMLRDVTPSYVKKSTKSEASRPLETVELPIEVFNEVTADDKIYLLILKDGALYAYDDAMKCVVTKAFDPTILNSTESTMLIDGILLTGESALNEALDDLLH